MAELRLDRLGSVNAPIVLVFLHGGPGMDCSYFHPFVDSLADDAELVFYRQHQMAMPGMSELVEELDQVISQAGDKRVVLVGHSFGSCVALEYLRSKPADTIHGLILVSWLYNKNFLKAASEKYSALFEKLSSEEEKLTKVHATEPDEGYRQSTINYAPLYFADSHQTVGREVLSRIQYNQAAYSILYSSYLQQFDLIPTLRSLRLPVLSLAGLQDRIVDAGYSQAGANVISNCRSEVLPAGHFPFVEATQAFVNSVRSYLKGV